MSGDYLGDDPYCGGVWEMRTFDALDSQLINLLQHEFPLAKEPYRELATRLYMILKSKFST